MSDAIFDGDPTPLACTGAPAVRYPVDDLPGPVADMVRAVAVAYQVDAAMAGSTALVVLAAAAAGRVEVEVRPGWREVLSLHVVTVADPGEKKSAVQAVMTAPLIDAEAHLAKQGVAERLEAETTKQVAVKAAEIAKATASRAATDSKATDEQRKRALAEALAAERDAAVIDVPAVPRIIADDVTPEAAQSLLADQGGRLAIISSEGGIFDIIAGRYSNNIPSLEIWLKGHSGDPVRVDRKGRPPEHIPRPALTMGLMIQPSVLQTLAQHASFRGRGLLARFMYCIPPIKVGRRTAGPPPVPEHVADAYHRLVRDLTVELSGWRDPAVLTLTADAHRLVVLVEEQIEPELGPGGSMSEYRDWGAKLAGATMRLAALLHLATHGPAGVRRAVQPESIDRALRLAGYFKVHARVAFEVMGADTVVNDAHYLLGVIRRLDRTSVSRRDLFSACYRGRFPKTSDMDRPLGLLVDHGWLAPVPVPAQQGPGRPPSPRWHVHPVAISAVAAQPVTAARIAANADIAAPSRPPRRPDPAPPPPARYGDEPACAHCSCVVAGVHFRHCPEWAG